jgi:hypothetical protein
MTELITGYLMQLGALFVYGVVLPLIAAYAAHRWFEAAKVPNTPLDLCLRVFVLATFATFMTMMVVNFFLPFGEDLTGGLLLRLAVAGVLQCFLVVLFLKQYSPRAILIASVVTLVMYALVYLLAVALHSTKQPVVAPPRYVSPPSARP